jgi:cytochrome c oxidase subunit IV
LNRITQSPGFAAVTALAIFTLVEYLISTADVTGKFYWLAIIAIVKAVIIVISFMHIKNLFEEESG